jgi:threonine dehydrogenase-like Zn-dependent dehydrogenase
MGLDVSQDQYVQWLGQNAPRTGGPCPISVDASAIPAGLAFALRSLAPGGVCTTVAYYFQEGTPIPLVQMYVNQSTLTTGLPNPRADFTQLFDLIRNKSFKPERITTMLRIGPKGIKPFWNRRPRSLSSVRR